jgi:hypothetical protein
MPACPPSARFGPCRTPLALISGPRLQGGGGAMSHPLASCHMLGQALDAGAGRAGGPSEMQQRGRRQRDESR